jgi:hypothetical protein
MAGKYAQKILFFSRRPCGDYHEKTHPQSGVFLRSNPATMREATCATLGTRRHHDSATERGAIVKNTRCRLGGDWP